MPDPLAQPLRLPNFLKPPLPKRPPVQTVPPPFAPEPLVMIRCHTGRAVLAIMIYFTKRMDLLARDEDPRCGRRHVQFPEALLPGRI